MPCPCSLDRRMQAEQRRARRRRVRRRKAHSTTATRTSAAQKRGTRRRRRPRAHSAVTVLAAQRRARRRRRARQAVDAYGLKGSLMPSGALGRLQVTKPYPAAAAAYNTGNFSGGMGLARSFSPYP